MMKRLAIGAALLALIPFSASAGEKTAELAVERMTCALCPITVTRAIEAVRGVIRVSVDFDAKRALVRYDDAATTWRKIAEASTNAGYPASKVE